MRRVFLERVARHYQAAGWAVSVGPHRIGTGRQVTVDLLVRKGGREKAVIVVDEPPGPFRLAELGAVCRKLKVGGVVVSPDDPRAADLCEQAGLEFVPGETIGETVVIGAAPPPVPIALAERPAAPEPLPPLPTGPEPRPPVRAGWVRWLVVALIWALALALLYVDLRRLVGP